MGGHRANLRHMLNRTDSTGVSGLRAIASRCEHADMSGIENKNSARVHPHRSRLVIDTQKGKLRIGALGLSGMQLRANEEFIYDSIHIILYATISRT